MWHWEGWGRREREVESGGEQGVVSWFRRGTWEWRAVAEPPSSPPQSFHPQKHKVQYPPPPPPHPPPSPTPLLVLLHVSRGAAHARCRGLVSPSGGRAGGGWRARRQTGNTGLPCLQVEHVTQQRRTARKTGAARGAELIKHLCSRLQPAGFHSEPSWLLSA